MKPKYPDPARVWQRVLPTAPQEQQSLQMLLRQLSQDLAFLKQLSKTGEEATLGLLIREYTGQLHCLKGILILTGGTVPRTAPTCPPDHSLRRCFDGALQRLGAWQLRSSDPIYGPVFRDLAHQTQHHCRSIAELLDSGRQMGI